MKMNCLTTRSLCLLALLLTIHYPLTGARAQDTAFTYQGRLNDANGPATGLYDLTFGLYDGPDKFFSISATIPLGSGVLTNRAVPITNGLFTVTLDFGYGVFDGNSRWLELGVQPAGGTHFATLAPRQSITATPYAQFASQAMRAISAGTADQAIMTMNASRATTANTAFSVSADGISGIIDPSHLPAGLLTNGAPALVAGSFAGNGAGVTNVDLKTLNTGGAIQWLRAGGLLFSSNSLAAGGSAPHCAALADLNHDGIMELISVTVSGSVTVLTNSGSTYGVSGSYPVSGYPSALAVADVNHDGRLDLITANTYSNTLAVLLNDGAGHFVAGPVVPTGPAPGSIVAVDVNQDGWVDLVSAGSGTVTVLTNNGSGGFALAASLPVGLSSYGLASADVNGDGQPDLITANLAGNTLTVLTNAGHGRFAVAASPATGLQPYSVTAADVNGDGQVDLLCPNAHGNSVTVLTNNGAGGFVLASTAPVGLLPVRVVVADLNADGRPDLICANNYDSTVSLLTGDGKGGFTPASVLPVGGAPWWVAAGDLDRNGQMDLVTANAGDDTLTLLLNQTLRASFTGNGAGLDHLNAGNLAGLVSLANLPDAVMTNGMASVTAGKFYGDGSGLTNLDIGNLVQGAVANQRLSTNIARLNGNQTYTGTNTFAGTVAATSPNNVFAGSFSGNGYGLTNLNMSAPDTWLLTGNYGITPGTHFLGTKDGNPLELRVNNLRGLSLTFQKNTSWGTTDYTESINLVGGYWGNSVLNGALGATIAGGGAYGVVTDKSDLESKFTLPNLVTGDYGTVSGGAGNTAGYASSVSGGISNTASGYGAAVIGGTGNTASGDSSLAAGRHAHSQHSGSFVWADHQDADFSSSGDNQFLIRAGGGVGINTPNVTGAFTVRGAQSGGWSSPLSFIENNNNSGSSGPALRLLSSGYSPDGVLNVGNTGTGKILALGAAGGEVANVTTDGMLTLKSGLVVDSDSSNSDTLSSGLQFGAGSGEGIYSRRSAAGRDQWGLDLCTRSLPRVTIVNSGNVGIGTTNPQAPLEINTGAGNIQFRNEGGGMAPGLNIANAGNSGVLRLRNALEIWPDDAAANAGRLSVRDKSGNETMLLNGDNGEATVKVLTITGGADIAEPFSMPAEIAPGTVVVIDEANPGQLKASQSAYDTRVAGVVSGANGIHPGLALHQQGVLAGGQNVALTGRVYALADASCEPIKPGDLLTSANAPGCCMKATDATRTRGAVLGKAMTGLSAGRGLVLVLVNLQ